MSGEYSVVFTGKVLDGLDLNLVKSNLAEKLKLSTEQVSKLFESAPRLIKTYDTNEDADSLVAVFKSCGAVCIVDIAVPDWELVDDESQDEEKSNNKSRGLALWAGISLLVIAAAYSVYIFLK